MSPFWEASVVMLWIVVGVVVFLLLGTMRQLGLLLQRLGDAPGPLITPGGLAAGTEAPDYLGKDLDGNDLRLSDVAADGARTLLVFLSTSCSACLALVPHLREVASTRRDVHLVVVCAGETHPCHEFLSANRVLGRHAVDSTGVVQANYDVQYTPFAFVIDGDRRVVIRGVANDWTQLEGLLLEMGTPQSSPFVPVDGPNGQAALG